MLAVEWFQIGRRKGSENNWVLSLRKSLGSRRTQPEVHQDKEKSEKYKIYWGCDCGATFESVAASWEELEWHAYASTAGGWEAASSTKDQSVPGDEENP